MKTNPGKLQDLRKRELKEKYDRLIKMSEKKYFIKDKDSLAVITATRINENRRSQ